jgi:hypothetical protein
MSNTQKIIYKPVSFTTALGLTFIILRLTGVIDWSWWWVTLPLWGGYALLLFIATVVIALLLVRK